MLVEVKVYLVNCEEFLGVFEDEYEVEVLKFLIDGVKEYIVWFEKEIGWFEDVIKVWVDV